jgi:FtsZ-binding cell division protein ZapB
MIEPAVEVGAAIALFDSEGTPIPAPIGSYELSDGRVVVVEVDGVIASITEPTAEGEEMGDDKSASSAPAENAAVKRLIERIEKVSEFEKQIAELKEENAKAKTESDFLHKENDELKSQFAELKQFTKETLETIKGLVAAEESKKPVAPEKQAFRMEKKENGINQYFKK